MLLLFYKYFENSSLNVFCNFAYGTGNISSLHLHLGSVINGQECHMTEEAV